MAHWGLVIDISRCVGCYGCFIACKDEHWDNDYLPYTSAQPKTGQHWMNLVKKERGVYPCIKVAYMPVPCMHCADAPCIKSAENDAVYRRPDGIVVIDPEKSVGQRQIVKSCPYGAIYWNEEKNLPQKCTLCVHRLEQGKLPRCVQACPSECLKLVDLDEPQSEVAGSLKPAEVFHPEWQTQPAVHYLDLHKITRYFIAGAVVCEDTGECAEGVTAVLKTDGKSATTITNSYGNFEFDGLESGRYSIKLEKDGYSPRTLRIDLKTDKYLGDLILSRAER